MKERNQEMAGKVISQYLKLIQTKSAISQLQNILIHDIPRSVSRKTFKAFRFDESWAE